MNTTSNDIASNGVGVIGLDFSDIEIGLDTDINKNMKLRT
jgi:hypothetical protein